MFLFNQFYSNLLGIYILGGVHKLREVFFKFSVPPSAPGDSAKGWWDDAFASSVASIARGDCLRYSRDHITIKEEDDAALMRRVTHPLCAINRLLSALGAWPRGPAPCARALERTLAEHARTFAVITLAFEKVPLTSLKSSDSLLYSQVTSKQPSYLIKKVCALCYTLRSKNIPDDASADLRRCYRQCLLENYKCFCAAVCVSCPAEKFYGFLFDPTVWEKIVDPDVVYKLPLQSQWNRDRKYHVTAANVPSGGAGAGAGAGTGTLRTRVFLRTLSVDPLQYDLLPPQEQEDNAQELELCINELNSEPLVVCVSGLVNHAALLAHHAWRGALAAALGGDATGTNVKWILAQVIYNCRDKLIPHASVLRPALLQFVAKTACDSRLNGLHIDVLDTVLYWQSPLPETSYEDLATSIMCLMNTSIDNGHRTSIFGSLLSMLGKLAELYGAKELRWDGFYQYFKDPRKSKYLLSVLLTLAKHKVYIHNLLSTLSELDGKLWSQEPRLSELMGYLLSCTNESERAVYLSQHRKFLSRRAGGVDYVKLLYYTQKGYPQFVDGNMFK
ncbi:unnamed protein product [Diatraea saccharalis]|uniref:DNA-dependent protein kinase catalytic subunit CC3 domain-containing protein n=1 Tax=Diatraea saccharalis TaxID=40085 RepID=A0A9N9R5P1_9NEOP|nr:unnamed protein product [Diatraea saccharalis]